MLVRSLYLIALSMIGYSASNAQSSNLKITLLDTLWDSSLKTSLLCSVGDKTGKVITKKCHHYKELRDTKFSYYHYLDTLYGYRGKSIDTGLCRVFFDLKTGWVAIREFCDKPYSADLEDSRVFPEDSLVRYDDRGRTWTEMLWTEAEGEEGEWPGPRVRISKSYAYSEKTGVVDYQTIYTKQLSGRYKTSELVLYGSNGEVELQDPFLRIEGSTGIHPASFTLVSHSCDSVRLSMWTEKVDLALPWESIVLAPKDTFWVPFSCKVKSREQSGKIMLGFTESPKVTPFSVAVSLEGYNLHPKDFKEWEKEWKQEPQTINRYKPVSIKGGGGEYTFMRLYPFDPELPYKIAKEEIFPLVEIPTGKELNIFDWSNLESGEYVLRAINLATNQSLYRRITIVEEL